MTSQVTFFAIIYKYLAFDFFWKPLLIQKLISGQIMTGTYLFSIQLAVSASFPPPSPSYFMSSSRLLQLKHVTKRKLWSVKKRSVQFLELCLYFKFYLEIAWRTDCSHLPCHIRTVQEERHFRCSNTTGAYSWPLFQVLQRGINGRWLPHA